MTKASETSTRSKKWLRRSIASWSRWLHIYLSMISLAVILFFSVTGLTLNHPEWFFSEQTVQQDGTLPTSLLHTGAPPPWDWDGNDYSHEVAKLEIAEFLRAEHALRGTVAGFLVFEDQCEIAFEGPGYAAIARVQRSDGSYTVDVTANDFVTVMNDLHKGRNTGVAWSWVIDFSAIIGTLVAVTGFALIFFLKLRRRTGLAWAAVGSVALCVMYFIAAS